MFSDYKIQIDQILKNTEKEKNNNSQDKIAAVAMYKIMAGAISKFIEKESRSDPEFDAALSLDWKSAGRMLKYIWSKAEKMALTHGSVAACCLAEEAVYAWVREYYFLDDREAVMEERAKKAEAAQKQKEAKEKEAGYRKTALDILSKQGGWNDLLMRRKRRKSRQRSHRSEKRILINLRKQLQRPTGNLPGTMPPLRKLVEKQTQRQPNPEVTVLKCTLLKTLHGRRLNLPIPSTARLICLI